MFYLCSTRTRQASQRCSTDDKPRAMSNLFEHCRGAKEEEISWSSNVWVVFLIEEELNRSKEDFVTHFKEIYSNPYPPAWILMEILPFGVVTNIYANIKNKKLKKRISQSFDLQVAPFESWLTIVAVTRNSCGHHSRIWNRVFSIRATIPVRMTRPWLLLKTDPLRVYFDMCIIKYFLDIISPSNDMLSKMQSLFAEYPEVDLRALGFPSGNWQDEPLWSTQS